MIHYSIQIIVFQLLFLVVYDIFLKKETFFTYNRVYLLLTPIVSLLLPFIKLSVITQSIPEQLLTQLENTTPQQIIELDTIVIATQENGWNTSQILMGVYFLGVIMSIAILAYKGYRLYQLKKTANVHLVQGIKVIQLPDTDVAFSFFGSMFLGTTISEKQRTTIFAHEKIHIQQRHSLDLLFFEMLRIVFWFNPLIYIFQNRLILLQEFIADSEVAQKQSKQDYCESLLSQVFQTENISFINTFFNHSLIKKRIIMLQKSKSNRTSQLKYLILVPLVFGMLVYTSCSDDEKTVINDATANQVLNITSTNTKSNNLQAKKGAIKGIVTNDAGLPLPGVNITIKGKDIGAQTDFDGVYSINAPEGSEMVFSYSGLKSANFSISDAKIYNVALGRENVKVQAKNEQKKNARLLPPVSPASNNIHVAKDSQKINLQDEAIPFAIVDKVPVYPGCEGASTNKERKQCMSTAITKEVLKNFNTKIAEEKGIGLKGNQRISVQFKIDKTGKVVNVIARAPLPVLEAEALRVINELPLMIPGQQDGKNVGVLYSLPILFQING